MTSHPLTSPAPQPGPQTDQERIFMRRSRTAMTLIAAPLLATAAFAGMAAASTATTNVAWHVAAAMATSFPAHYAAPYLQISGSDAGDMAAGLSATGDKYCTLA